MAYVSEGDLKAAIAGTDAIWSFQLEEAEKIVSSVAENNCLTSHVYAAASWMKASITDDKDDCKKAFERLTKAHNMAKSLVTKTPSPSTLEDKETVCLAKIILAETNILDAALKFRQGAKGLQKQVKGVLKFRKAYKHYGSAQKILSGLDTSRPLFKHISSYVDSGLGFFHFLVSIVPREFVWLVEGIGFKGDRDKGMEELKASAAADGLGTPMAMLHLTWIHAFFLEDLPEALKWQQEMLGRYPTSAFLHYLAGYVHRKNGNLDMSECSFINTQMFGAEVPMMQCYAEYDLGYERWLNRDWVKCQEYMEKFVSVNPPEAFRVFGSYQLAVCYHLNGQPDKAMVHMKKLLTWVRKDYDYDAFAERRAKKYIASKGMTEFEKKILFAIIAHEARQYKDATDYLLDMAGCVKTSEEQAIHTFLRGDCALELGKLDEAKACFDTALRMESKVTSKDALRAIPGSLTGLAVINIKNGNHAEAKKLLEKAAVFYGYDFAQLQGWKITRLKDICRNQGTV